MGEDYERIFGRANFFNTVFHVSGRSRIIISAFIDFWHSFAYLNIFYLCDIRYMVIGQADSIDMGSDQIQTGR